MTCVVDNLDSLRQELTRAHKTKYGMDAEKAEHDFIVLAQSLAHYGGHFYTATWVRFFVLLSVATFKNVVFLLSWKNKL